MSTGILTTLDQPRALDTLGTPTSAVIYYYYSETTNLAPIYTDLELTSLASNPVVISAGQVYPNIFIDPNITYRRRIVYGDGSIHDLDPLSTNVLNFLGDANGSSFIGFQQSGIGAQTENVQTVLRNLGQMVTSYGAVVGGGSDTAAIQAALDTGAGCILFPPGDYHAANLTMTTAGQRLVALGRVRIYKNANGPIIACSGVSQGIEGIEFQGVSASYTGNNVNSSGNFFSFRAGSEDAAGRAVYCTGGAPLIMPGPWRIWTADTSATGYDIYILGSGSANLYGRIIATYSSQATGGILLENTGAVQIQGGQFGKLTIKIGAGSSGHTGPVVTGARVVGDCVVEQSGTHLDGKFAGNVTIGDGANAISGIVLPTTFTMQSPNTLTINALVTESAFHLGQLYAGSVNVSINATSYVNNDIWHGYRSYTPTWAASSANPALGNGTLAGAYSRNGRTITATFSVVGGSTTTWGTGAFRLGLPAPVRNSTGVIKTGSGLIVDASAPLRFAVVTEGSPGDSYMTMDGYNMAGQVANTAPFTFATGDQIYGQLTYDC